MVFTFKRLCALGCLGLLACSAPRPAAETSQPVVHESTQAALAAAPAAPLPAAAEPPPPAAADALPASVAAPVTALPADAQAAEPRADSSPDASGWGVAAGLKYLEIVRGGAGADDTLPLLIVIHGLGDHPHRDWLYAIDVDPKLKARMILPQAPTPYGRGFAWFPYRFGDHDDVALAGGISEAEARLAQMIEVLRTQRPTRGRAVVCGFSQGGMLSYALALGHPELVQFALPISGELPPPLWPASRPKRGASPRIVALHGTTDTVVRFEADDLFAQHLRAKGYPIMLLPFENVGHHISEAMSERAKTELSTAIASLAAAKH
ncbi:MAG TPA: dienelactone hydrolase family protein [Polyangiales bacterium]|nr:dienelactone hydrolase family protein [Polyangiales bacterium]